MEIACNLDSMTSGAAGFLALAVIALASACGGDAGQRGPTPPPARAATRGTERLELHYDRHLPSVPVRLDGYLDARFAFDTGIGINLVSKSLCRMLECVSAGQYVGRRMSGQEVTVPLARVRSLAIGHEEQRDVVVGVIDLDGFVDAPDIQGFVSLGFFARRPFTLDERQSELVLEDAASLEKRVAGGTVVSVDVRREGESVTVFLPLEIAGQSVVAEVDTGSDALILDERFMAPLGIDKAQARVVEGRDETGHAFTRWFTDLSVAVHPAGAPESVEQASGRCSRRSSTTGSSAARSSSRMPSRSIWRANGSCSRHMRRVSARELEPAHLEERRSPIYAGVVLLPLDTAREVEADLAASRELSRIGRPSASMPHVTASPRRGRGASMAQARSVHPVRGGMTFRSSGRVDIASTGADAIARSGPQAVEVACAWK